MRISEREIVASLLEDASPDLKRKIAEAVEADPECEAAHAFWADIAPALRELRAKEVQTQTQGIEGVMQRLRMEASSSANQRPATLGATGRPAASVSNVLPLKRLIAGLGVAACILAIIGYAVFSTPAFLPQNGADRNAVRIAGLESHASKIPAWYVEFSAGRSGSGTEMQPFNTLAMAVDSAKPGETIKIRGGSTNESLKIERSLRLVAENGGSVRIGSY